jgi:hypothetical protein
MPQSGPTENSDGSRSEPLHLGLGQANEGLDECRVYIGEHCPHYPEGSRVVEQKLSDRRFILSRILKS